MKLTTNILIAIMPTVFLFIGILICIADYKLIVQKYNFLKGAGYTKGTIVKLIDGYGQDNMGRSYARSFYKVVEYKVDGQYYQDRTQVNSGSFLLMNNEIGKTIGLYYDPQHPDIALMDTFTEKWFDIITCSLFGFFFITFPAMFLFGLLTNKTKIESTRVTLGNRKSHY